MTDPDKRDASARAKDSAAFWRKIAAENYRLALMFHERAREAEQFARDEEKAIPTQPKENSNA